MKRTLPCLIAIGLAVALSGWAATFSIDASVYYPTAYAVFFDGAEPYFGSFGLPWPMWYRYPPLFLVLVLPLSLLPFRAAAFLWALGKFPALYALARSLVTRLQISHGWRCWE